LIDVGRVYVSPADEAVKIGKDAITTLLAPAKDVVALLDLVAQVHPAVQVRSFQLIGFESFA